MRLEFSPDGRTLASASYDQTARLWDLSVEPPISWSLSGRGAPIGAVAFSPDGLEIAFADTKAARLFRDELPREASALHQWLAAYKTPPVDRRYATPEGDTR
jgi:hypothetical protein